MVALQQSISSPRRASLAFVIIGLSTLLGACSSSANSEADWPRQPSPSYPAPEGSDSSLAATESADQAPEPAAVPAKGSSNALAKDYDGKKALETLTGKATYYADSLAGNHTANGDVYDPKKFTAAHKKLPFGTILRVVREDTGVATYVRVNDRGPFGSAERIIDLSRAAAEELDMMKAGVLSVRVEILEKPEK